MIVSLRFLAVLIVFQTALFSCNLCKLDIPNVHIKSLVTLQKDTTKFEITWSFDSKFISSLTAYDVNKNQIFEPNEQQEIKKSLLEYLVRFNYLTQIALVKKDEKITEKLLLKISSPTYSFSFANKSMSFTYQFILPIVPIENYKIVLYFFDLGNNFNFVIKDVIVENYKGLRSFKINANKAEICFYDCLENQKINLQSKTIKDENNKTVIEKLSSILTTYKTKIENIILDTTKTNSLFSYSWLLFFSFVYGVLHAIGPGHGKSLVSAYFLSENHSTKKAFTISMLIGVVHTFSAFLLTLTIYFVLNMLFTNVFTDIEKVATKISGGVIILIAVYLLYKKYTYRKKMTFTVNKPTPQAHQNHSSCVCGACSTNSTDLGVILSAGIVPCAGTVSVFLFTMGLGVYFIGLMSAIFMSFGMSLVIFITAYLSKNIRNKGASNGKLLKLFEYGSLVFILFLGIILVVSA